MGDMADYYNDFAIPDDDEIDAHMDVNFRPFSRVLDKVDTKECFPMVVKNKKTTTRRKKPVVDNRPTLVKVGRHLVNPLDVRAITQVRKDLYVIKFISEPNPQYACWVDSDEIAILIEQFNVIVSD